MTTTERTRDARRRTARVLSLARESELTELWRRWEHRPEIEHLRAPESGLVMVQGRTGGTGDRFHLGEATVTRATVLVRTDGEESVGTAYVLGSRPEHAELAAIFDGMLASPQRERVLADVIEPLERALAADDGQRRADARSTVVDFFTVARENSGADDEDDE